MTDLPPLTETTTLRRLVEYAGASGDFYDMHYDLDFAHALGHPELAVHGLLKAAYLGRLVTGWLAGRGRLTALEVSYRGMDFRDRSHTCHGRVVSTEDRRAELELWGEDDQGRRTTLGRAEITYPEAVRPETVPPES